MTLSNDTKPIWTSQTVWGAAAAIGAGLSTAIYSYQAGDSGAALSSLVAAFGGITALVGRIKATSKLGLAVESAVTIADQALMSYAATKAPKPLPSDPSPSVSVSPHDEGTPP